MLFTTNWISTIFRNYSGVAEDTIQINEVVTDSRTRSSKSLFIPIVGENFDGHDFIKQAFDNGAVATIWNKNKELPSFLPTEFPVFFVDDTLRALQGLAAAYRKEIDPVVIGITGSNGKTTTKDLIASVMKSSYKTHATNGNFNNEIGLPLTVLAMDRKTEVLVLEMGMSNFGEIERLSKIALPDYAVITNIGESHIEYLGSREGIAKAKSEIVTGMTGNGYLLIDGDEPLLSAFHSKDRVIRCGFNTGNTVEINQVKISQDHTGFVLADGASYSVPLLGSHHALNATFAITLAKLMSIDSGVIQQALSSLQLTSMRFEMVSGRNDVSIINDAYNASPTSMKAAIDVVKQMSGFSTKILVLGDILELGEHAQSFHESIADVIDDSVSVLFTLGDQAKSINKKVTAMENGVVCKHFSTKEELAHGLEFYLNKDTLVLFKASRGMQFEKIIDKIK
ncbi:UDP-N-acetylmuramoylalanyl-D-glutamate--2,6-diaminopimelate ligase [Virgibacillus phasianinus]|uniref:UDP-N-acetylmuramoyl-tripeptide--D-alanyl-D-alanine ligase n=1 Tax=Virgibacillus phasianinus TaxID=2017483 RepID=A0A220U5K3_9BACI|nr:UDP-N-acetylmuramoyl-tripeptide--D-alanyl-D-alanine ligase [Virgibacillus phasianinus]ASK63584.1 UDP-N-acetylmuramoylalanyl-D-glutamate--2,6-diaminopimelate ligase [Virgibacillus phasianinus]